MSMEKPARVRGRGWGWALLVASFFLGALDAQGQDEVGCLKCHALPQAVKQEKDGSRTSLYVNEEAFNASIHHEAGLGCADCHPLENPTLHPAIRFPKVGCASCHPESWQTFNKTSHGLALLEGRKNAPNCADCHTSHYMRKIADPQSPVNNLHLPGVCSRCHEEANPPRGFIPALSTYRLVGHRKVNLGERYDTQNCAGCHPETAGHLQTPRKDLLCLKCHDPSAPPALLFSPIHYKMSFKDQPVSYLPGILNGSGLMILILGGIVFISSCVTRARKARRILNRTGKEKKTGEKS